MRLPKFRCALLVGAVIGVAIPIASVIYIFSLGTAFSTWTVIVWPSSILLIGGREGGPAWEGWALLGISVGINIVLYAIVFALLWSVGWVLRAWRASLRDGTTI